MPKIVTDLQQAIDALRGASEHSVESLQQDIARRVDPEFAKQTEAICKGVFYMLCDKNAAYGNSALDPIRVFSRADADEQIKVRIDDKLSRVKFGSEYPGDDTVLDTIGYLILLLIANQRKATT
jgi:hypothetical protein